MNIFFTDECPIKCAENLDDKRVVKMVLETAQLLSTAINEHGGSAPYKSTHVNHPSAIWARQSKENYWWLIDHFVALCHEYKSRYGRDHKCSDYINDFIALQPNFEINNMTEKPNCAANRTLGISYKSIQDIYLAYKLYLNDRWENDKRTPTWYGKAA